MARTRRGGWITLLKQGYCSRPSNSIFDVAIRSGRATGMTMVAMTVDLFRKYALLVYACS